MLTNQPAARATLYYITLFIACLIIVFKYIPTEWAANAASAGQDLITFLGGIIGWTAAQNISKPTTLPPAPVLPPLGGDFPGR